MFSFSGHGEVLADLSPFLDDNLGPVLSSMRRTSDRIEPQDERTTWAQAEMFVAEELSNGCQEEQLEIMIEQECEVNHDNGDFDPLFLRYCLRILRSMRSMRDTSQFSADVPQTARAHDGHAIARDGSNKTQAKPKNPTSVALPSGSRKDNNAAEQMENCQLLDQGTEERLQQMRKRLHREAERTWHENAVKEYRNGNDRKDQSQYGDTRQSGSPSPRPGNNRRVEFPGEPTMTESSLSGLHHNSRNVNTSMGDQDYSRGRNGPRPASPFFDSRSTSGGRSSSITPGDSVSQCESSFTTNIGADFSRLRPGSSLNTSDKSNIGSNSWSKFDYMTETNEGPFEDRIRWSGFHAPTDDLGNMFHQLRVTDHGPGVSNGRRDNPNSVSRDRKGKELSHRSHRRGNSTDIESTIIPEESAIPRRKEKHDRGWQSNPQYENEYPTPEMAYGPRVRSEFRGGYSIPNQCEPSLSLLNMPSNTLASRGVRQSERSDLSSMRAQASVMGQESRREGTVFSQSTRPVSHHGFGSPLVDGRPESSEGSYPRGEVKHYGRGWKESRSAGNNYIQPYAETSSSTTTGYTSRGKRSTRDGPLKRH